MMKIPKRDPLLLSSNSVISTLLNITLPKKNRNMTTYKKLKQTSKTFPKKKKKKKKPARKKVIIYMQDEPI